MDSTIPETPANAALIDYEINNRHTKEEATKLLPRLCIEETHGIVWKKVTYYYYSYIQLEFDQSQA